MRALNVPAAGHQPEVSELPVPAATEGTVLIKVMAASLNAIDVVLAGGMAAGRMAHHYPLVVGRDADPTVGADRAGSGQRAGPDHDDPATRAARGCKPGGVVAAPCATATAEHDSAGSSRKCSASEAAPRQVGVPAVAAQAALSSVGPAAAARVLIVDRWVRVGSATARGARRTSGRITAGVAIRHGGN